MNSKIASLAIAIIATLSSIRTLAQAQIQLQSPRLTVMGDEQYYVYDDGFYRFIYTANDRPLLQKLIYYNGLIRNRYEKNFNWKFDERPYLILASDRNQIANGLTTSLPRLFTIFYPNGAQAPDEFASDSWLNILLAHETSHLYQLNQKEGYSEFLKKTLGDSNLTATSFLPPFTYTEFPNEYLPTFILEGNAVFNEDRFGNGGRLYNGRIRAVVLQLAKAGKINSTRLMNAHLNFPYTDEKYWVGGYLQEWLAEKFGAEKVDRYFYNHAFNNWNPLKVNEAFLRTFGIGYETAIRGLVASLKPLYRSQKSDPAKILFSTKFDNGLTKEGGEIRVLTADGKEEPRAYIYHISSHRWSNQKIDVPMGRVFHVGRGCLAAAGALPINNKNIKAGLFADGEKLISGTQNKFVYDKQGNHLLYGDANKSFLHVSLYTDDTPIGAASSSAIYGPDLKAYYFQQDKKNHVMYRNHKRLFSYRGYWGFPVDVDSTGAVYFIGPLQNGSTLFRWQNGHFQRMTASDVVVDAKLIDGTSAVVAEASDTAYNYKIIPLHAIDAAPFEYVYSFEKDADAKMFQNAPAGAANLDSKNERPYNSWSAIRYEGLDPYFLLSTYSGVVGGLNFHFSDPLFNHSISLSTSWGDFSYVQTLLSYLNSEHILNWTVLGQYAHNVELDYVNGASSKPAILDKYNSWLSAAGLIYPYFVRPEWKSTLSTYFVYQNDQNHIPITDTRQAYTNLTRFELAKKITEPRAYDSYRQYSLELANEAVHNLPWTQNYSIYAGEASINVDLWRQTYLSATYQDAFTDGRNQVVQLRKSIDPFPIPTATRVYRLSGYIDQDYFESRKSSIQLKQAFDWGYYFPVFPISLRRFAVLGFYNQYNGSFAAHANPVSLFHESGGGLEAEFLLAHNFPARLDWIAVKSSYSNETDNIVTAGTSVTW